MPRRCFVAPLPQRRQKRRSSAEPLPSWPDPQLSLRATQRTPTDREASTPTRRCRATGRCAHGGGSRSAGSRRTQGPAAPCACAAGPGGAPGSHMPGRHSWAEYTARPVRLYCLSYLSAAARGPAPATQRGVGSARPPAARSPPAPATSMGPGPRGVRGPRLFSILKTTGC